MPRVSYDITTVDPNSAGGWEVFPPQEGPYILQIKEPPKVTDSKKGKSMMVLNLTILAPDQHAGKTFRQWYSFSLAQLCQMRMAQLAKACSVVYDRSGFDTDDFTGAVFECDLLVDHDDGGREFNRIDNPRAAAYATEEQPTESSEAAEPEVQPQAAPAAAPAPTAQPAPAATIPRRAPMLRTTAAAAPVAPRRSVR